MRLQDDASFILETLNPGTYTYKFGWGGDSDGVESSILRSAIMFYRVV